MRLALTTAVLLTLSACGTGTDNAGPERGDAAGDVTDDMLPLDSLRSTSPVEPRRAASGSEAAPAAEGEAAAPGDADAPGDAEAESTDTAAEPPAPAPSDE